MKLLFFPVLFFCFYSTQSFAITVHSDVSNRIDRLEKALKDVNKKLSNNYVGPTKQTVEYPAGNLGGGVDSALQRAQEFEESFRQLTDDVERMNFERQEFYDKQKQIQEDIKLRFADMERRLNEMQKKLNAVAEEKEREEKALKAAEKRRLEKVKAEKEKAAKLKKIYGKKSPKVLYNQAFNAIKKKNYKSAEKQFEAFLQLYPKDALAGNAQYWLGESFFARGQYENAAIAFAEGFQKYRESQKAPDNLFKLGLTMSNLKKKNEACIAFKNFSKEYPKVSKSMKKRLEKEIAKLSCP